MGSFCWFKKNTRSGSNEVSQKQSDKKLLFGTNYNHHDQSEKLLEENLGWLKENSAQEFEQQKQEYLKRYNDGL